MDYDSHAALVEFDANYWNLVERALSVPQQEPCVEQGASAAQPQASSSRSHTAEQYLPMFETMETAFRDEFRPTSATSDDSNVSLPAQVIGVIHVEK